MDLHGGKSSTDIYSFQDSSLNGDRCARKVEELQTSDDAKSPEVCDKKKNLEAHRGKMSSVEI